MSDERSEAEKMADEMFGEIDPYFPSSELWGEIQNFINQITAKHGADYVNLQTRLVTDTTEPSILEIFEPAFFRDFPLVRAVLVLGFSLKKSPNHPDRFVEGAMLLLDADRKAYAFSPTSIQGENNENYMVS